MKHHCFDCGEVEPLHRWNCASGRVESFCPVPWCCKLLDAHDQGQPGVQRMSDEGYTPEDVSDMTADMLERARRECVQRTLLPSLLITMDMSGSKGGTPTLINLLIDDAALIPALLRRVADMIERQQQHERALRN